jgi:hypothetical protein
MHVDGRSNARREMCAVQQEKLQYECSIMSRFFCYRQLPFLRVSVFIAKTCHKTGCRSLCSWNPCDVCPREVARVIIPGQTGAVFCDAIRAFLLCAERDTARACSQELTSVAFRFLCSQTAAEKFSSRSLNFTKLHCSRLRAL